MFQKSWQGSKLLAIAWLLFISILFFLPGSTLPKAGWLDEIYFDKWVHFGLFAILLLLWRFHLPPAIKYSFLLIGIAIVYGFGVELIQKYWIPNRSFDLGDVIADTAGGIAGVIVWTSWYKKK